jgi:hypothetical protein
VAGATDQGKVAGGARACVTSRGTVRALSQPLASPPAFPCLLTSCQVYLKPLSLINMVITIVAGLVTAISILCKVRKHALLEGRHAARPSACLERARAPRQASVQSTTRVLPTPPASVPHASTPAGEGGLQRAVQQHVAGGGARGSGVHLGAGGALADHPGAWGPFHRGRLTRAIRW